MESALVDQTSEQFLGQWKRLVSTTNWEKGQIICNWREALKASGAPASEYSDDAWSRRVGNVTPQHVGRLRRAYERFGGVREDYLGLYWSHFQAALDWDDAEMWLEGAVQNDWSVADMRSQRAAVHGTDTTETEDTLAEVAAPWDEDAEPSEGDETTAVASSASAPAGTAESSGHDDDQSDEESDDASEYDAEDGGGEGQTADAYDSATSSVEPVRPFANLPPLPADVNDAFEAYKLCILRHKLAGWQEISRDDLLSSLDALRQLVLAPTEA
jgi:hypothetical protein